MSSLKLVRHPPAAKLVPPAKGDSKERLAVRFPAGLVDRSPYTPTENV
jgi:hypothetical protein